VDVNKTKRSWTLLYTLNFTTFRYGTYHRLTKEPLNLEQQSVVNWWLHKGLLDSYLLEELTVILAHTDLKHKGY